MCRTRQHCLSCKEASRVDRWRKDSASCRRQLDGIVSSMSKLALEVTEDHERFVTDAVAAGRYRDASEVVREGLRLLERREAEDAERLGRLRAAVGEGEAALARGDYEDVADDELDDWLARLEPERATW